MEAKMVEAKTMSAQFVPHYYNLFDTNRAGLAPLYADVSIMFFENDSLMGQGNILQKITNLPFQAIQHITTTIDAQPTVDNGVIIHVVGQLKTDNDPPHSFSETFHLKQAGGSWIILNQMFRLSLHHG